MTSPPFYSIVFVLPQGSGTKIGAGVAQVVAHLIGNEEVGSSSLLASSQRLVRRLSEA